MYLKKIISKKQNGLIKIITGLRRSGKSYLLFEIYKNYLNSIGVDDSHIIQIALDKKEFEDLRNPNALYDYIQKRINKTEDFYIFIDEIQLSYRVKKANVDENSVPDEDKNLLYTTFYDILNDLMAKKNLDIYVTGSNSRLLSKDVATNFRDRGCEIQVFPLSFGEFYEYSNLEKADALEEYMTFGGMPLAVLENSQSEKEEYLKSLFKRIYLADIKERYNLRDEEMLDSLVDVLFSSVGSLTNPNKLKNTMESVLKIKMSDKTIKNSLDRLGYIIIVGNDQEYINLELSKMI